MTVTGTTYHAAGAEYSTASGGSSRQAVTALSANEISKT